MSANDSSPPPRAERLQNLHAASLRLLNLLTVSQPEETLLQRAAESLAALIGARYGAIGVLDENGALAQFMYTGIAPEEAAGIGRLPEGRGLLGAVIHENQVLRIDDMNKDPRAAGFPPNHPPMRSLLAVPVSHAGRVYGRVYLSEKTGGVPFTDEDEQLALRFAEALALTLRFHRAEAERARIRSALQNVAHAVSSVIGEEFFRTLVLDLAKALNVDYAFVGRLADERSDAVETVAVNAKGLLVDNFTYELKGTPCLNVVGKSPCQYPRHVQQQFPDDRLLKDMGIESYVGCPLFGSGGQPLGLLVVMDSKPMRDPLAMQAILQICTARAAAELERRWADGARMQTEAEMRKLASAVTQTADAIVITDADGVIEYVNPAFERTTGYAAQEAVGRKANIVKSSLHDAAFYERLWQTIREGKPFRDVFINRRKNGDLYFEEKTITPLKDAQGRIAQFVSTGKDITGRMQAEIALRESERRYAELIEQAPDAIVTLDLEGRLQTLNPAAERLCGYRADELAGKHFAEAGVVAPESLARAVQEFPLVVAGEERPPFELAVLRKDGARVFTEINPRLIRHSGRPAVVQVTVRDITERKRAEEALARAASEWTYSMDFMEDALYLVDLDDKVMRANRAFYRLTDLTPERVIGQDVTTVMHPAGEAVPCRVCAARRARRDATVFMEADDVDNPTGRPIEVMVRIVRDAEDRPASVLMGIHDLTRTRQVEADLRQSRARLLEAQRMAQLGNWEIDLAGNKLTWSDEIYRIFEIDPAKFDASYEAFLDAIHPDDRDRVNGAYTESVRNRTPYDIEHRLRMKDGRVKHVHEHGETFYDDAGKPLRSVGTVQDITERKRTEEQLNYLAYYDTLTGLPNRTLLLERLHQATADADRVHRLVAVMFLDLDRFKYINDTLGHHVGDGLLKAVAERLQACVRAGDTIARLGGDEFTVVLANVAHVDDVARVARKLIDSFVEPFRVEGRELFTTTSIGVTLYPFDEREAEGLLKNADTAMYHAKERGRNTFQYYTAELNVRAERRLRIETALRTALERGELSLHYQPQVDLKTGRITGMEALARWNHPELGNVSPAEFIPVAEDTGLILPIGEWVLREACRQIKSWHDTGFTKLQVAVNLSGKQLRQKDFPDRVRRILRETKLASHHLDLELTESLLMVDTEETADIMHALHAMGVSFSVDDFGTGYSSLAYLKRFPIDVLKIDRSFVRDIATDPNDLAIVKTVIAMAHTLGMKVVAEGVETREQLEFLRDQGCDGSQGYYCSMPLSAEEFSELLADWKHIRADRCTPTRPTARTGRRTPAKNGTPKRIPRRVRAARQKK